VQSLFGHTNPLMIFNLLLRRINRRGDPFRENGSIAI